MQLSQLCPVESYRLIFPGRVQIEGDGEGRAEESMPWGTALINEYFQQKTSAHISDIMCSPDGAVESTRKTLAASGADMSLIEERSQYTGFKRHWQSELFNPDEIEVRSRAYLSCHCERGLHAADSHVGARN